MANIPGTPNDDVLVGTADTDVIEGLEGNDVLAGLGGADAIIGGPGNNVIIGGPGDDTLVGGESDTFIWNNGDGTDFLDGSGGTDVQVVNGAAVADEFRVDADAGLNTIFQRTSAGPFTIAMNNVETLDVRGLAGNDVFTVTDLSTTDTNLVIFGGGAGNDVFNAATSRTSVIVHGGEGNDTITTGLGNDWVDGGTLADTIVYAGGIDTVWIELADTVLAPGRTSARATLGATSLVLDFGAGNILALQWLPGEAITAQTYLATNFSGLTLL
jgi:Ca2+-binding RTX toxin-like protein